jgi:hypothetical protein
VKAGDLVTTNLMRASMYNDISDHHRILAGTMLPGQVGLAVDSGYSTSGVRYLRVLCGEVLGWVRVNYLETLEGGGDREIR